MKLLNLTLAEMLCLTRNHYQRWEHDEHHDKHHFQVFGTILDWRYWRLSDYVVSSAVSGPSVILIPRLDN